MRIPSKYGWMSFSLNESNLNQLRHVTTLLVAGSRKVISEDDLWKCRKQEASHYQHGTHPDLCVSMVCRNGMKLNIKKTRMLVLKMPAMLRTLPPVALHFCGTAIADAKVVKNLGMFLERAEVLDT